MVFGIHRVIRHSGSRVDCQVFEQKTAAAFHTESADAAETECNHVSFSDLVDVPFGIGCIFAEIGIFVDDFAAVVVLVYSGFEFSGFAVEDEDSGNVSGGEKAVRSRISLVEFYHQLPAVSAHFGYRSLHERQRIKVNREILEPEVFTFIQKESVGNSARNLLGFVFKYRFEMLKEQSGLIYTCTADGNNIIML